MADHGNDSSILAQPIPFGKYYLLERIATGGMAEVFKAKAFGVEGFERLIAVKRILPTIAENAEFTRMFVDEAKLAGQLQHANIAQIFDLGRVDESYYIALEFVAGRDLRSLWERLRGRGRRLPLGLACHIMTRVLEGLEYAHNKTDAAGQPLQIVHRDVSPQNMLVSYEGEVKLIDFGVAKAASSSTETRVGILKGKLSYMSPEQVRGLAVDRRSDTFSCGTVLYELVTGERLFVGESDFETLEKIRKVEVAPPTLYNPDIPRELEDLILHALQKNPNHRFESAQEMLDALQRFMITSGHTASARDLRGFMQEMFATEIAEERARNEYFQGLKFDRGSGEGAPVGGLAWDDTESETQVFQRNDEPVRASGARPAVTWARRGGAEATAADSERTTVSVAHHLVPEPDSLSDDAALDAALDAVMAEAPAPASVAPAPARAPASPRDSRRGQAAPPAAKRAGNVAATQQIRRAAEPAAAPAAAPATQPPPADKRGGAGWGIALAFALLIGLGGWLVLRGTGAATGSVNLIVEPATSAAVSVDGASAYTGRLPHLLPGVTTGRRTIAVSAEGFEPLTVQVDVTRGQVAEVRRTLVAAALPPVALSSTPAGARATLDGRSIGTTPAQLDGLRPGARHTLQLVLDGWETVTHEFVVTSPMAPLEFTLVSSTPSLVALDVASMPAGAAFQALGPDGQVAASGTTPGRAEALVAGTTYSFRFELAGHDVATVPYTPSTAAAQTVAGTLQPAAPPPPAEAAAAATPPTPPAPPATGTSAEETARREDRDAQRAAEREREERAAAQEREERAAATEAEPEPPAPVGTGPGRLNVASRPAGRLIIDGADTGLYTPIRGYELAPGRYRIELVNEELGMRRRFTVQIVAGGEETIRNVPE